MADGGRAVAGPAIGCTLAVIALVVLLLVGGGVAAFMLFRVAPSPAMPAVTAPAMSAPPTVSAKAAVSDVATVALTFGEEGNGAGQTQDARSIGVDMDENVYLADYNTARVQKFDATGKFQWIIEVPKSSFSGDKNIWSLVCDTKGTLWVSRTGDLLEFAQSDGKSKGVVKGNYDANTWFHQMAMDPLGNMVVLHTAAGDSDLLLLDSSGKVTKRIKNHDAAGLAMDGAGNVYVTDRFDYTIEVLDKTGATKAKFGSKTDKHTSGANAIAVDGKNHIFVETSEGVNVFDQGGGFIATIPDSNGIRDLEISTKGNLFLITTQGKVKKLTLGAKLK